MIALGDATMHLIGTTIPFHPQGVGYGSLSWIEGYGWSGPGNDLMDRENRRRHPAGRFNLAFCDGRLESIRADDLFSRQTNSHRARWNNDNEPHY